MPQNDWKPLFLLCKQFDVHLLVGFFFLPSCQSVRSWRVDPIPTPRADTLLHKPSMLCCLSTRAGCMDYWCQHRAGMAAPVTHTARSTCFKPLRRIFQIRFFLLQIFGGDSPLFMHTTTAPSSPPSSSFASPSFDFMRRASQLTHMYFWLCSACWSHPRMD